MEFYTDREKTRKVDSFELPPWDPQEGQKWSWYVENTTSDQVFVLHRLSGESVFDLVFLVKGEDGTVQTRRTDLLVATHPDAIMPGELVEIRFELAPIPSYSEINPIEEAFLFNQDVVIQFEITDGKVPVIPVERYRMWLMGLGRKIEP